MSAVSIPTPTTRAISRTIAWSITGRLLHTLQASLLDEQHDPWPEVRDKLNRLLRGWSNYFGYGSRGKAYRSVDQYVFKRLRRFLARRHKVQGRGNRRFTFDVIHRELGVVCLHACPERPVVCLAVKPVGKPDAGNRLVRFGNGAMAKVPKLPRPYSTLPSPTSVSQTNWVPRQRKRAGIRFARTLEWSEDALEFGWTQKKLISRAAKLAYPIHDWQPTTLPAKRGRSTSLARKKKGRGGMECRPACVCQWPIPSRDAPSGAW